MTVPNGVTKVTAAKIDELKQVLPKCRIVWDGLGWERYAFAIPGGNSHVHLNLTCTGPAPDDFGLHFSLYGTEFAGDFLKPVHATADPLCCEFAIDVPGRSLARREAKIPLTITIVPAVGQTVAPDEPCPVYLDSGWTSDDSSSGEPVVVESISATDLANSANSNSDISPAVGSPPRTLRVTKDSNGAQESDRTESERQCLQAAVAEL